MRSLRKGYGPRWLFAVVLSGVGCTTSHYDPAPNAVGAVGGVLYSNALAVNGQVKPRRVGRSLSITYPLLFQNEGLEPARLGLASAAVLLNGNAERVLAICVEHGRAPSDAADLPPGRRLRVDCELTLNSAGLADARRSDSELVLSLPVLSAGRVLSPEFGFRLLLEDGHGAPPWTSPSRTRGAGRRGKSTPGEPLQAPRASRRPGSSSVM